MAKCVELRGKDLFKQNSISLVKDGVHMIITYKQSQWRRENFVTGEVRYGFIEGLEYEVPQSRLYCLCINVALCSTICRVIRRSSMTMKAHTYYIIFGRPPIGGEAFPFPPSGSATEQSHYSDIISKPFSMFYLPNGGKNQLA